MKTRKIGANIGAVLLSITAIFGYEQDMIDIISFTDSLIISTIDVKLQSMGPKGPVEGQGDKEAGWTKSYELAYNEEEGKVTVSGSGFDRVITLDEEGRVIHINNGDLHFTDITYNENEKIIEYFPNEYRLTEHSVKHIYRFNERGDTTEVITIPTVPKRREVMWSSEYADTITYAYDAEGRLSTKKIVDWNDGYFGSGNWRLSADSLYYTYETIDGKEVTTIREVSRSYGTWKTVARDMLTKIYYDEHGRIAKETAIPWEGSSNSWNEQYLLGTEYTYENNLLKEKLVYQTYGDGTDTVFLEHGVYSYQKNPLIFGETSIAEVSEVEQGTFDIKQAEGKLIISSEEKTYDAIHIYDLSGRLIKNEISLATNLISLEGVASQPLVMVAFKQNKPIIIQKFLLQ